jgi:hypothetical protein
MTTTGDWVQPDLWKVNNIVSSIYFIINITCASIFIHSRFHATKATAVVNPDDDDAATNTGIPWTIQGRGSC